MADNSAYQPSKSSIEPSSIPIGATTSLGEFTFIWDGRRFTCETVSYALYAVWKRRLIRFLVTAVIAGLIAWMFMNGLDWESMTLDERRPYSLTGRIAAIGLLAMLVRLFQDTPWVKLHKLDEMIREREGIGR